MSGARDEGVSSVVAAVLLFGLFTTIAAVYAVQTLPEWQADNEFGHHREVGEQLRALRTGLEALSARDDPGPLSVHVPLAAPKVPLLQQAGATAELSFVPGDGGSEGVSVQGSFVSPILLAIDGVTAGNPSAPIESNHYSDVATLMNLKLGMATYSVGNDENAWAQVEVTGADGSSVAARLTHFGQLVAESCYNDAEVRLDITSSLGVSSYTLLCSASPDMPMFHLDLMTPLYAFEAAVQRLPPPYTITLTDGGYMAIAEGVYTAVWQQPDGLPYTVGGGLPTDFAVDQAGGTIEYSPRYQSFVQERLVVEAGAVLAVQDGRQAIVSDPGFELRREGTSAHLAWTILKLDGAGSMSGPGANVQVTHRDSTDVLLRADGASFQISSAHAQAWRSFFQDRALAAGLQDVVLVGGAGDVVTLDVVAGGGLEWTFQLKLVQGSVRIT